MEYLSLELKVCEVCGALWFRQANQSNPYCNNCRKAFIGFPRRQKRPGPRPAPCRKPRLALVGADGEASQ